MKLLELEKEKKIFVRILIGLAETGKSGIKKPIKTMSVDSEDPEEVYEALTKLIKENK